MAAFILATLISTLLAFPAYAVAGDLGVTTTSSVPKVLPNGSFTYTVTFTNASGAAVTNFVFTDTVTGGGTMTAASPSVGTVCPVPVGNATTCTTATFADVSTVVVTFNVTAPATPGTVTDTVSAVGGTGIGTVTGSLVATTTVENADLSVTKTHAGVTTPGGALTYTITILNAGPSAATAVGLNDTAPANVTFGTVTVASVPAGISTCLPAPTATTIACAGWTIPSGTTVTVTVPAILSAAATAGSSIANTATTTATSLDATPANNSATDTFVVAAASVDLGVTLAVAPTTAVPGGTVTYTVTVTNPDIVTDATNVVVTDALPSGLTAVTPPTAPSAGTAAVATNTWTWTIPAVAKATSASTPTVVTATFDAVVDPSTVLTTITNTATMTATQTDPVSANNTATVDLTITPAVADLDVLTAVDNAKPSQGDKIAIAIQVSNAGPDDATNVVLKDVLPNGLKYDSCSPCNPSGLRRSTSQQFSIASIPANSSATLTLTVTVQASSGTLQNKASIVSEDQSDPNGANDSDALQITIAGTNNSSGGGSGGTSGTSGGTSGTGGTTAFTGFTAGQLIPWFLLLFSLGLAAIELARRKTLVSPIGSTYGFDVPF